MSKVLIGRVWRFEGVLDVDWEICAKRHIFHGSVPTFEEKLRGFGQQCLINVDPEFPKKVHPGDFVVGGAGFGYGHDHDVGSLSLRGVGVGAVIVEAVNTNFQRNSITYGLPVVPVKGIMAATKTGDELELNLAGGTVKNLTTGNTLTFVPYPDYILEILEAGGVYEHLEKQIQLRRATAS